MAKRNRSRHTKKNKSNLRGGHALVEMSDPNSGDPSGHWKTFMDAMVVEVKGKLDAAAAAAAPGAPGAAAPGAAPAAAAGAPGAAAPVMTTWAQVVAAANSDTRNAVIKGVVSETTRLLASAVTQANKL